MTSRREFLLSTVATIGGASLSGLAGERPKPLGAQLYTVRDQAERDLPGVLAAIHKIGYTEVETYWNVYTHPAPELKQMIEDSGLRVPSGHFNYDGFEGKLDYAAALGVEYMVCPMLPMQMWTSLDGFKQAAAQLNQWGEQVKSRGMRLGYHNHNYEFRSFGGSTGFDVLMSQTNPNLVCLEMDCYWVAEAGRDPLQIFESLGTRIQLLHLKDRKRGFPISQELNDAAMHFAPVGMGTLDWGAIIRAARVNGVKHMFVEQDSGDLPPLEELKISYKYLQPLL